ncbi:DMT family transporter [Colwellia ponticola]|uniref:DMT family transporter n=1 Tax=Colwellia ponticola TaxID=2304625 RepID=A0A8H2PNJ5_9GAMM|nr:DMT family transporter [Colwellia ponticola]TMM47866.1 DMT family transporter [Colwellia ponticola]
MNNSFLYIITVLIWGSTWIAINYQLGEVSAEVSIFYRFGLAALCMFTYCHFKQLPLTFSAKQHGQLFFFGLTLFGANYYLIYHAQAHINSALTSIAFSTLMMVNIINARICFKTHISSQVYFGGGLGLFGIVTLFWPQISNVHFGDSTLLGLGLSLIGVMLASTGNMISIKNQRSNMPVLPATAWGMMYGAIFMGIVAMAQGQRFNFAYTVEYISSLLYLSVFGSVIAFGCYLTLLARIGAHKASYATIMFPAVAVVISSIVEGFVWDSYTLIGLSLMLTGNLVVLAKPGVLKLFTFHFLKTSKV